MQPGVNLVGSNSGNVSSRGGDTPGSDLRTLDLLSLIFLSCLTLDTLADWPRTFAEDLTALVAEVTGAGIAIAISFRDSLPTEDCPLPCDAAGARGAPSGVGADDALAGIVGTDFLLDTLGVGDDLTLGPSGTPLASLLLLALISTLTGTIFVF